MSEQKTPENPRSVAEQIPLAFSHEAASGRDDLLVTGSVVAAVSIVDEWPNWPSPVVVLAGPKGSGKSHLAKIWQEISGAVSIHPTAASGAARNGEQNPVLFEDADRRGFDDTELFHTINTVRENKQTLLITSRDWPANWDVKLPDLRSRLKAVTVVEIGEPDDELLTQVLFKLFADRQLFLDEKLIGYIVTRMERSLDTAQMIVERLDTLALSRGTRITRTLAAEVLNEFGGSLAEE